MIRRAMPLPIRPRPINPTFIIKSLYHEDREALERDGKNTKDSQQDLSLFANFVAFVVKVFQERN